MSLVTKLVFAEGSRPPRGYVGNEDEALLDRESLVLGVVVCRGTSVCLLERIIVLDPCLDIVDVKSRVAEVGME